MFIKQLETVWEYKMGYKSKFFNEERFYRWLKKENDVSEFLEYITLDGMKTINRIIAKHLNLGEYATIWERPDWRRFLYDEECEIDSIIHRERLERMTAIEEQVIKKLFAFAKDVKPFIFGNPPFNDSELQISIQSEDFNAFSTSLVRAATIGYVILNHTEVPIEYEVVESYLLSRGGKKIEKYETVEQSDGSSVLEHYSYTKITDMFSIFDDFSADALWKVGIKVLDKTNRKMYHAKFRMELEPKWISEGWESEQEWREYNQETGDGMFDINYIFWRVEQLEICDVQSAKPREYLLKKISRSKKAEKELGISIKHVGCDVSEEIVKSISVMGDVYPNKDANFTNDFEMICNIYDLNDRLIRQKTETIHALSSLDYESFKFDFYGIMVEEVGKIRIAYRKV